MRRLACLMSCSALFMACLQGQISAPSPGYVRYAGLPIQSVLGVPGNFLLSPTVWRTGESASFSSDGFLVARQGHLQLFRRDGSLAGDASVSRNHSLAANAALNGSEPLLSAGRDFTTAIAWLPDQHCILYWDGNAFQSISVGGMFEEGTVSSIQLEPPQFKSGGTARLLIVHPEGTVSMAIVSLPGGNLLSSAILPGVQGPAFQFGEYLLWRGGDGLEIRSGKGVTRTLPFAGKQFSAEQMSSQWVHLFCSSTGTHWALHLSETEPTLSRLPVPAAARTRP